MTYCKLVAEHYERCWSGQVEVCQWLLGPREDLPENFHGLRIAPSFGREMWSYATVCMSREDDDERVELHLVSPLAAPEHVELLTAVAHYHRTGAKLGCGHTVNFGRPWFPGSRCTHGLISLPYLDGPSLEVLELDAGIVRFLWLIPITKEEVEFKKVRGLEALEARLENANFDYLDPRRRSVV